MNCFYKMMMAYADCGTPSLSKILEKRGLAPSKLDEIKIKFNILKAFVEPKTKETVGREESEL